MPEKFPGPAIVSSHDRLVVRARWSPEHVNAVHVYPILLRWTNRRAAARGEWRQP
jgi:hypothetical protein